MIKTERIQFPGAFGDRIAARLELPEGPPTAFALFAHCFTCTKDYKAVVRISRKLAEGGVAVCRFDFTGLGESQGDFATTNFTSNLEDLLAAAQFLREYYEAPQLLIGHSLGGTAILAVATRIPEARAVVTIAAPSDTEHLSGRLLSLAPELAQAEEAEVKIAGRSFRVRQQLLADLESHKMGDYLTALDRPLLILHSTGDETVDVENAVRLFEQASFPKSLVTVDGADHLLANNRRDWQFVAEVIGSWASRYLSAGPEADIDESTGVEQGRVVVKGGPEGFTTEVLAGRHPLTADEPVEVGGEDSGPNPYSLLLAALGACKAITLRMYADRKGWPLRGSQIELSHSRIHARDCEECESNEGRVDRIEVSLQLIGNLSDEQSRRLFEISERCPVQRTLRREVSIRSRSV